MLKKFFDKHFLELISIANHSMTQTTPITCVQNNSNRPALGCGMKRLYDSSGAAIELRSSDNVFDAHLASYGQRRRSRSTGRLLRRIFHIKQRLNSFGPSTLLLFYRHHSLVLEHGEAALQAWCAGKQGGRYVAIQPVFCRKRLVAGVVLLMSSGGCGRREVRVANTQLFSKYITRTQFVKFKATPSLQQD
jgi:hypothetical protein